MYDLAIIGGGPAGVAAGVYAARKRLKTILLAEMVGGQSTESAGIENWIGTINISGVDFGQNLEKHLRAYADKTVEIKLGNKVSKISKEGEVFSVTAGKNTFQAKTMLVTTGSQRRKLEIPGAKEFEGKGVVYCASCDGPLFAGQDVVVVGGGNAGFESAAQLLSYCKSVTLLNRSDVLKADEATVEEVMAHPNMKVVKNAVPKEVKGDKFVSGFIYEDSITKETKELDVTGIFVEIGLLPNTDFLKDFVALNKFNQIPIDPRTQRTQVSGLWAAGDATDVLYHQNNIAAGDAVRALEDIYLFLHAGK